MNDDTPAFPTRHTGQSGMTLRDYAAIHILAGLYAGRRGIAIISDRVDEDAHGAYAIADAMMEARK